MEGKSTNRIAWIDIFKAICIILMVIGHSTGRFNQYIYQFHMAAFFFISGYTSKIWKKDLESVVLSKIKTVLLPIITMIVGLAAVRAVKAVVLSELTLFNGVKYVVKTVVDYLIYGVADSMLGAMWFLPVLFFVFVLQMLLWRACEKRGIAWFAGATVLVYLIGYYLQANGYRQTHCFDMALIAQVFFGMGVIFGRYDLLGKLRGQKWRFVIYALAFVWMYVMTRVGGTTVDYPSRRYPDILLTVVVPIGGIIFAFGLSNIIEFLGKKVGWLFTKIGNATMGVLFLHFIGFKVATALLMPFKITVFDDLKSFLLPEGVKVYGWAWIFYTVISLAFSVTVWTLLMHTPIIRTFLGGKGKKKTTPEKKTDEIASLKASGSGEMDPPDIKYALKKIYEKIMPEKTRAFLANEGIDRENCIEVGHPAWVTFFLYMISVWLVEAADLICYLLRLPQTTVLSRCVVAVAVIALVVSFRRKVCFSRSVHSRTTAYFIAFFVVYGFIKSICMDLSYDTQNYHLIIQSPGFAEMFEYHVAPGSFQMFGFRLPDRMFYPIRQLLGYRMGTLLNVFVIALTWFQVRDIINIVSGDKISRLKEKKLKLPLRILRDILCNTSLIAFFVVITHDLTMQFGTYCVDLFAIPIVMEMLRVILSNRKYNKLESLYFALLCGFLLCIKMTNIVYLIPLLLIYIVKNRKNVTFWLFTSCVAIALVPVSVYLIYNFAQTGNPVFPYYNEIFKSSYFPVENFKDERWGSSNLKEYLLWPVYMIFKPEYRQTEIPNPWSIGGLVVLASVLTLLVCMLVKLVKKQKTMGKNFPILIVFVISYLGWSYTTGHIRYFVLGYVLGGILVADLVFIIFNQTKKLAFKALALLCAAVFSTGPIIYLTNTLKGNEWSFRNCFEGTIKENINYVFKDQELALGNQCESIDMFLLSSPINGSTVHLLNRDVPIVNGWYINKYLPEKKAELISRLDEYASRDMRVCDLYGTTSGISFNDYIEGMNALGVKLVSCEWVNAPVCDPIAFFLMDLVPLEDGETNIYYHANSDSNNVMSLEKQSDLLGIDLFAGYTSSYGWYPTEGIFLQTTVSDDDGNEIVKRYEVKEKEFYSITYEEDITDFSDNLTIEFSLVFGDGKPFDVGGPNKFMVINPSVVGAQIIK